MFSFKLVERAFLMADEEKPRAELRIPAFQPVPAQTRMPSSPAKPMRTQEELTPLALRVMENAELIQQFRAVIGSEDRQRADDVIDQITRYAQSLDSSITVPEGTRIVVVLMNLVGHPRAKSDD
jgi:hypothetical protein